MKKEKVCVCVREILSTREVLLDSAYVKINFVLKDTERLYL